MYDDLAKRLRYCSEEQNGCGLCALSSDCVLRAGLLSQAADAIEELSKPRWIPVTERLPEKRKWVMCRCEANIIEVLRWENDEWYHDLMHVYYPSFVTHWMPLPPAPEPPKEEARITVTCTKCPCKGACDELPEDMSCEDVLAYYAI